MVRLKLRREFDVEGRRLAKPLEEPFATLPSRQHLAAFVAAGQAALLNPDAVAGLPGGAKALAPLLPDGESGGGPADQPALEALGEPGKWQLAFTRNCVVVELDGAEADLTLFDLPGAAMWVGGAP